MRNFKITNAGLNLLGTTNAEGTPRYWIGYYGLAYVPDRDLDPIDDAVSDGVLTKKGDNIYNIWQGDMVNGYAQNNPDDTAAANLFGLTLYDKSIRTNYRYVYDSDAGRNQLVAWKSIGNEETGENTLVREGYNVYLGACEETEGSVTESGLPLPAPLFYAGEPSSTSGVSDDATSDDIVSDDVRYYKGTTTTEEQYGWMDSSEVQDSPNYIITDSDKRRSISNFNKFHGTVSSEGYGVSSVSSCHNMSKATKLFPISHYTVVNDNKGKLAETKSSDDAKKPLASAIKYTIDLSLITSDAGYMALYDGVKYGGVIDGDDQEQANEEVYNTVHNSFKFNRIGIYAVPMSVHRYSTSSQNSSDSCNLQKVQFEINGDEDPILFAVADINDTLISDSPEEGGIAKFKLDFILNLGSGEEEGQIERRTAVYYNLYENDAITWYKNQLLATASLSEAVTGLSLEMNALKQHVGDTKEECCSGGGEIGEQYALKNHTHDYLRNLVDGFVNPGSVRGIDSYMEGSTTDIPNSVLPDTYSIGKYSLVLGERTADASKFGLVQGEDVLVDDKSDYATVIGSNKVTLSNAPFATVLGSTGATIKHVDDSLISMASGQSIISVNGMNKETVYDGGHSIITGCLWTKPSEEQEKYAEFKSITYPEPAIRSSIINDTRLYIPVSETIIMGNGGSSVGEFFANSDYPILDGAALDSSNAIRRTILLGPSKVGMASSNVIAIGGSNNVPEGSLGVAILGDSNYHNTIGTMDTLMTIDEFNEAQSSGDLTNNQYYTILGDGTINVYHGTAELSGSPDGRYPGVYVNSVGQVSYEKDFAVEVQYGTLTDYKRIVATRDYRMAGKKWEYVSIMGGGNYLGSNSYKSIIVGSGNTLNASLKNALVLGDANYIFNDSGSTNYNGYVGYDKTEFGNTFPAQFTLSNVQVFGTHVLVNPNSYDDYATSGISNALIQLPSVTFPKLPQDGTNISRDYDCTVYGVFKNPVNYVTRPTSSAPDTPYQISFDSWFLLNPSRFSNFQTAIQTVMECSDNDARLAMEGYLMYDPTIGGVKGWEINGTPLTDEECRAVTLEAEQNASDDDIYIGDGSYSRSPGSAADDPELKKWYGSSDPFLGYSRKQIRTLLAKPPVPMAYTGGIALAGYPQDNSTPDSALWQVGDKNYGLIKLGSLSRPVAYIRTNNSWLTKETLYPMSVVGTTKCPYNGRVLSVTDTQELDGTMHVALTKLPEIPKPMVIVGAMTLNTKHTVPGYFDKVKDLVSDYQTPCVRFTLTGVDGKTWVATLCGYTDTEYLFYTAAGPYYVLVESDGVTVSSTNIMQEI